MTMSQIPKHRCQSANWSSATQSTRRLVTNSELNSEFHSADSIYVDFLGTDEEADDNNNNYNNDGGSSAFWRREEESFRRRKIARVSANGSFGAFESGSGSGSFITLGRRRGTPSTSTTTTSLQRDFDGEGYNEDVDSIADLIDSMHRDFLLTSTTTTMTTTRKTTEPDMRGSTTIKKYDREFSRELSQTSTRSGGAQSGKWDTSVDQIIPDIFARIYGCKGVPQ